LPTSRGRRCVAPCDGSSPRVTCVAQVAGERELEPLVEGVALQQRHDRHAQRRDRGDAVGAHTARVDLAAGALLRRRRARAERATARAQHDDELRVVEVELRRDARELRVQRERQAWTGRGGGERQGRDAARALDLEPVRRRASRHGALRRRP
jgi:hypothetical protein